MGCTSSTLIDWYLAPQHGTTAQSIISTIASIKPVSISLEVETLHGLDQSLCAITPLRTIIVLEPGTTVTANFTVPVADSPCRLQLGSQYLGDGLRNTDSANPYQGM